jgi:hypothetical protein
MTMENHVKFLSQDSMSSGGILNARPPEYKVGMLTTWPQPSMAVVIRYILYVLGQFKPPPGQSLSASCDEY